MHLMAFIDPQRMREDGPMLEDLLRRLSQDWDIRSSLVLPEDLSEDLQPVQDHGLGADAVLCMPPSGPLWLRQNATQSLLAQVHRNPPDLVLCIGTDIYPDAEAAARQLDRPMIISTWSVHDTRLAASRMQHVGAWVAPTPQLAARIARRVGKELVQCIAPGITPSTMPSTELGLAPTLALLACDGNPEIVRATLGGLQRVVGAIPDLQICMELDAADGHQAWREADARGLLDHVSTIADATQVRTLLTSCDLIVHPHGGSHVRTMILEAMAAARTIVSAPAPDLDWIIDGQTAAIVEGTDPEAWASTLLNALNQPGDRMALGQGARARIIEHHDPAQHAASWARLLADASRGVSYPFTKSKQP